jgi:hypothetical protein
MIDKVEIALAFFVVESESLYHNVPTAVEAYIQVQSSSFSWRGLEGKDPSSGTNKFGEKERIKTMMSADIEHSHTGSEESADKGSLRRLELSVDHRSAHVIASREKPGTEGQSHGKRNASKQADPSAVERPVLFTPWLLEKAYYAREHA